jgi:hypothetical protein
VYHPEVTTNDFTQHPPYHERYCAFVDILGFSPLIASLSQSGPEFELMRNLLTRIHNPEKGTTKNWYTEFRAQSISDAVAISTMRNQVGLVEMLNATEHLTLELLSQGFFVRGAIVKGMLYHDDKMVFGEALVRAYQLESRVVRYPRIMIARDVTQDLRDYCDNHQLGIEFPERIRRADDGPWHVHVLRPLQMLHKSQPMTSLPKHWDGVFFDVCRMQIQKRLDEAVDNPRHFEKVRWFAEYWNEVCYPYTGILQINWPTLSGSA